MIANLWFIFIGINNDVRCFLVWLKEELQRANLELDSFKEKIKENQEKIKLNKQLPYLVGNIVEVNNQDFLVPMLSAFLLSLCFECEEYILF